MKKTIILVCLILCILGCGKVTKAAGGGSSSDGSSTTTTTPTTPTPPGTSFTPPAPTMLQVSLNANNSIVIDFGDPVEFCHDTLPLNECIWIYEQAYHNDGMFSGTLTPSNKLTNFTGATAGINSAGDLQINFSASERPGRSDTLKSYTVWNVSWNIAINSDCLRYANGLKNSQFSTTWVTKNAAETDWTTVRVIETHPTQGWPLAYPQLSNVVATPLSSTSVKLSWDAPVINTENYGVIQGYAVFVKNAAIRNIALSQVTVSGNTYSTTLTGLMGFTTHYLNVAPVNTATLTPYYPNVNWSTTVSVTIP